MDIYCGQLGMVIDVSYCVTVNQGKPCRNTVNCWEDRVEIRALLRAMYSEEHLREIFAGLPKSRLDRILEAVPRAAEGGCHALR